MKSKIIKFVISTLIFIYMFLTGCNDSPTQPEKKMIDSGSWYETGFTPWPHDGKPVESENFVIYSDAASLEARRQLSQICEDAFTTIIERLNITDLSILRFPESRNNKIHIYAYKNKNHSDRQ